ncbi:MAG: transposase [Sphaerochaetaceae bacterium]|nr:transposase [Sphaerochaetaceae bacterium]
MLLSSPCHQGCARCPFRQQCIRNHRKVRYKKITVQLEHQKYQKIAYGKLSSEFGAEVRVNRSIQVEGRFAFLKQQFGLRRFSSFDKGRVFSEWLICCMAANTVQLAARNEQGKVGTPFWYRIKASPEDKTA